MIGTFVIFFTLGGYLWLTWNNFYVVGGYAVFALGIFLRLLRIKNTRFYKAKGLATPENPGELYRAERVH